MILKIGQDSRQDTVSPRHIYQHTRRTLHKIYHQWHLLFLIHLWQGQYTDQDYP